MRLNRIQAIILDLDGVITRTASLHAKAWKQVFDDYLDHRKHEGQSGYEPFDPDKDYRQYVDGKPRYDGVQSYLKSRGIQLQRGKPNDRAGWDTVCAVGNRKNEIFNRLLNQEGAEVFSDSVEKIRKWKKMGLKAAVVSSSKNCEAVLKSTNLVSLFDVRVDGLTAETKKLQGKPAPDLFIHAAGKLGIPPRAALLMEDAEAGVQAGKSGEFGLVIGVAREGQEHQLRKKGADMTIRSFQDIRISDSGNFKFRPDGLPSALEKIQSIKHMMADKDCPLFLDYDGTLTPIVKRPEEAVLSESMRTLLKKLGNRTPTAVVSGRDLKILMDFVCLDELIYAGSHGFDIRMPDGTRMQYDAAKSAMPDLDRAEQKLRQKLKPVPGALVERKRFAVAVHYRNVDPGKILEVKNIVGQILSGCDTLRQGTGKKVLELQPDIEWHKGKAVLWLMHRLGLSPLNTLPFYLGDDITDEDAFRSIQNSGIGILIGDHGQFTSARYRLQDVEETRRFLGHFVE
ncbi:trehalose-phosphatase [bacterium]|nr:trehalose-phosphatase [bacterium]